MSIFGMTPTATLVILTVYCYVFVIFTSHCCSAQTTVRPYKFGFTIDEQQHRYEKRDERGIVMGEFGFITADGIYHVTVYATDEEGRFKILAMRNYPYESPPKTIDMEIIRQNKNPTQQPIAIATTEATKTTNESPSISFGQMACSSCFLPNKNNKNLKDEGKKRKTGIRTLSKSLDSENPSNVFPTVPESKVPKMIKEMAKIATNTIIIQSTPKLSSNIYKPFVGTDPRQPTYPTYTDESINTKTTKTNTKTNYNTTPTRANDFKPKTQTRPFPSNTGGSLSPVLPSATSRTVAPSFMNPSISNRQNAATNNNNYGPTSRQDDGGDLYRFKYILDYNGHTETGSRNGNKQGNYYSIGDDNVERTVEYVANEFGFQPKIRWRKLGPNEIQSKENALKEYEFVWFNNP